MSSNNSETEKDIAQYLGFNNVDELFQVPQLKKYKEHFEFDDRHFFKLDSKEYLSKNVDKLEKIETSGKFVGWNCILKHDKRYDCEHYKRENANYKNHVNSFRPLDCGHVLALSLFKYVKQEDRTELSKYCNADCNLFPQFPRANRNANNDAGQFCFEDKVEKYLLDNPKNKIYYNVEKIYNDINRDYTPIGTKIFACDYKIINDGKLSKNPEKSSLFFHVFIPNYGISSSKCPCGSYDLNYIKDFKNRRKFFEIFGKNDEYFRMRNIIWLFKRKYRANERKYLWNKRLKIQYLVEWSCI